MIVAVPSYRRATNNEAQTFQHWPVEFPLHVFVREEEHVDYAALLAALGRDHDVIVPLPTGSVENISQTRNAILGWCQNNGHDKVVMVDDDLHFICRNIPGDEVHLRPCELDDYRQLLDWFSEKLHRDYVHAAVSMREGNNRVEGKHATAESTRGIRMVGYNVRALREMNVWFRSEVDGREDLDMTLQLLRRGYPNIVTHHWAQGQKVANAPGGLSEYRDVAHSDASARKLAELHPGFVKLRDKVNTSGGEFGVRTETTIYWKKALGARDIDGGAV